MSFPKNASSSNASTAATATGEHGEKHQGAVAEPPWSVFLLSLLHWRSWLKAQGLKAFAMEE